jgi:hypothetical protein
MLEEDDPCHQEVRVNDRAQLHGLGKSVVRCGEGGVR